MDLNTTTGVLNTIPSSIVITPLDNYPTTINFRSKTEAIEQLCLKVFGATPVYGTDIEDFKVETPKEIWSEVETLHPLMHCQKCEQLRGMDHSCDYSCPECDALASHGVNDGPCEKHKKD
jgi:hypothetical protein